MGHRVLTDGAEHAVADVVDLGGLRAHALGSGATAVLVRGEATRDGSPVLGGVAVVAWGAGAILRVAGERVTIAWDARGGRVAARAGDQCRLCLGAFAEDADAVACACGVVLHPECHAVMITCAECGAARAEAS